MSDYSIFDTNKPKFKNGEQNYMLLNYNSNYVMRNFMIDNEETTLNCKSSFGVNVLGWDWKFGG